MPVHFDLTDLRLALAVAEAGSITGGARTAHLSLASASARVGGLESAFGLRLFARGRRGVRPTAAGEAFVHHARIVMSQVERMRAELAEHGRGLRGHVRVLANTAALAEFLPAALAPFLGAHRGIDVELEERPSYAIVQEVAAGRAEVGIVADTTDLAALQRFAFATDQLVAVAPPTHRLARRRTTSFASLIGEPFVGLDEASALQDHLAAHAARLGGRLAYRARVRGFDAVCRLVEGGIGVAVVSEIAARRCRATMDIRIVRLTDDWARRTLMICVRDLATLPPPARQLVDALRRPA